MGSPWLERLRPFFTCQGPIVLLTFHSTSHWKFYRLTLEPSLFYVRLHRQWGRTVRLARRVITQPLMIERPSEPLGIFRIVAIYCRFPFVPVLWPPEVDHASHLFAPPWVGGSVNARPSMVPRAWRNLSTTTIPSMFQTSSNVAHLACVSLVQT